MHNNNIITAPALAHNPEMEKFKELMRAASPDALDAMTAALSLAARESRPLTPEELESPRETLRRFIEARGACPPALAELLRIEGEPSKEEGVMADVLINEQARHYARGVSDCEHDLLVWLENGTPPTSVYSDPNFILDALDPISGGSTLESVNHLARVWWLCMKRLQSRLLEFAALDIPEPQEITEADVEAMQRELEEADTLETEEIGTEEHLARV